MKVKNLIRYESNSVISFFTAVHVRSLFAEIDREKKLEEEIRELEEQHNGKNLDCMIIDCNCHCISRLLIRSGSSRCHIFGQKEISSFKETESQAIDDHVDWDENATDYGKHLVDCRATFNQLLLHVALNAKNN